MAIVIFSTAACGQNGASNPETPSGPQPSAPNPNLSLLSELASLNYLPPPTVRFEHLSTEDGLSSSTVRVILQDRLGYLWIGTQDGLNKFDGRTFQVYRHDPEDPGSLRDHFIESLYEDRAGNLWIGTQSGWLERYDRTEDRFIHTQVGSHVLAMLEDSTGIFWVGTQDPGLLHYHRDTGTVELAQMGENFTSLVEAPTGVVWALSPAVGLGRYQPDTGEFSWYELEFPAHQLLAGRDGDLWLATWGGGLGQFSPETGETRYHHHDPEDLNSVSSDSLRTLYFDSSGALWIGTYEHGATRLDPETGQFTHYPAVPSDPHSLQTNSVTSIYEDRSGVLWIGNEVGGGLNKRVANAEAFGHYRPLPGNPNSLGGALVTSLHEDQLGALWIGTFQGVDRWDRATGRWDHFLHDPADPNSLVDNAVRSVYVDPKNNVWVGTEGGLDRYDRVLDGFVHYATPTVMWMQVGPSGTFWLATKGGLYQLEQDTGQLTLVREGYAWKIMVYEDLAGRVWVGTSGDGLEQFDPQSGEWRDYKNDPADPFSLSNNSVESIYESASGELWLGTRGGLNRFDRVTGTFRAYRVSDGLPNDAVTGILADGQGHLWLATGGGLSEFDPQTETFKNYSVQDGLQGENYWRNSYYKSATGEMFFGGENGFNAFHPDSIVDNPRVPPVLINAVSLFNLVIRTDLGPDEQLKLGYQDNFLSFDFAALDYNAPSQNSYAYKMEGVDQDWVTAGNRTHADYPNLAPGEYTFRIKGANEDGVWNEAGAAVVITITPPFWLTWWFQGLVLLALVGGILGAGLWRVQALENRSRELAQQVEERTTELSQTNLRLAQEIEEREQAEAALAQQAAETAVVEERNRLARELHDAVTQTLFSASLLAEALPKSWKNDPEEGRQLLAEIRQLSRGALAEMRTLLHELRPTTIAETALSELLRQLAESVTGREGIPVEFQINCQCDLPPDVHVGLYRIAQESLNNVVKHARATEVSIRLDCSKCAADIEATLVAGKITLAVADNGRGFAIQEHMAEGMGLGIMRERAESIGAVLHISSQPGEGTRTEVAWEVMEKKDDG
jgi:signal transduction histidine kinase/ligand-binding sensor domain-containing protein